MRFRLTAVLIALLAVAPAPADLRHRAVRPPTLFDDTPAAWLAHHANPSLDGISALVGDAPVVGLGDDTHGTHEYFQTKLRLIQELVERRDFRTVALEAPFADFAALNTYVLGGPGDPRAILLHRELGYWFWAADEVVQVVDWMRQYNQTRGNTPAVEIAGFDIYDPQGASRIVIDYLNGVDPVSAATATDAYVACLPVAASDCAMRLSAISENLAAHQSDFVAHSSQHAFDDAVHGAAVARASLDIPPGVGGLFEWRDHNMAINAARMQERRSSNGRIILWAHHEHIGRTRTIEGVKPMGGWLADTFGADYFPVGTCSASGSFTIITDQRTIGTMPLPPLTSDSYETFFEAAAQPLLLIPLRGVLPDWLSSPHHLRGGTAGAGYDRLEVLPQKFDAILYFDRTSPSSNFW